MTIGTHDKECAARLIELEQRVRALDVENSARAGALVALNADLVSAHAEIERLKRELQFAQEALAPAEVRAAALQQKLDASGPGIRRVRRALRGMRYRIHQDGNHGLLLAVVRRALGRST